MHDACFLHLRNYADSKRQEKVRAFYEEQHTHMTYAFVESMEKKYLGLDHFKLGIWSARRPDETSSVAAQCVMSLASVPCV